MSGGLDTGARASRLRWRSQQPPAHLLRGAYSLLANTAVTSALGMAFWVTAARVYPRATVGRDTVLISVMIELSTICQLSMGTGILRFLPDLGPRSARALAAAYGVTVLAAILLGSTFVLVAPGASRQLSFLTHSPLLGIGFVVALALWGIFILQDAALTATRRAPWLPLENGLFGALKLLALPILFILGVSNGVFGAWVLPMTILLVPVNALVFKFAIPRHVKSEGHESSLARLGSLRATRFLAQDYLASIFTQATLTVLPLLVIATLGAEQSAYFAMPFTIAMAFDTFAYGACSALVVEGTLQSEGLRGLAVLFARRVAAPLVPLAVALIATAPLILNLFGAAYARHGANLLRLLLCASLLRVLLALFSALARAQAKGTRLALLELGLLAVVLGLAVPLAHSAGIAGVGVAWLAANVLACSLVIPLLLQFLRQP
jgi:O-antigen/teichoic acid export membrane protein